MIIQQLGNPLLGALVNFESITISRFPSHLGYPNHETVVTALRVSVGDQSAIITDFKQIELLTGELKRVPAVRIIEETLNN